MSFDLNLTTLCDHKVFRELTLIDTDRRSIRLAMPLASNNSVRLYATDNLLPSSMYSIENDPTQIEVNQAKMIVLNDKWQSPSDYFEVTYVTLAGFCTKCNGGNYLDDISYDVRGALVEQRDEYLLMQNVEKFIITTISSNPFHSYIGTGLKGLIGSKITNFGFLVSQITSEITRALQKFQDLQSQYQLTGRVVTPGELLQTVNSIDVLPDADDPTIVRATVSVTAQSGKTVTFTQVLKLRT